MSKLTEREEEVGRYYDDVIFYVGKRRSNQYRER